MSLKIYCIYRYPKDFPNKWVVRLFENENPTDWFRIAEDHEGVCKYIPEGLFWQNRMRGDDPAIVEVWF